MKKKAKITNGYFAVQFSKACYAYLFMRETFPDVIWSFEVRDSADIIIRAFFDDTPEEEKHCDLCAKQLASLFADIRVVRTRFNKTFPAEPYWALRGVFELDCESVN